MKFVITDAGRIHSDRPFQDNDCTVRALALACDLDYDVAYDFLAGRGRKSHQGLSWPRSRKDDKVFSYKLKCITFPPVKGHKRMTHDRFVQLYPKGRFIVQEYGHVSACVDGVFYEDVDRYPSVITSAWKVIGKT